VMITGALPHIAMTPLHDLYYAETTTSADQASLALMWKATWGMFDAILYAGFGLTAVGITLFGIAMMNSPAFGKSSTYLTLGIGILSVVAAIVILVTPDSPTVFLNVFGLITISTRLGWNMLWLSGSQQEI